MKKTILPLLLSLISLSAFSATLNPVQLLNPAGSSSGQTIVSTGSSSAPGWATVPLSGLSSVAANTVLANFTGSSAAPTAFAMPSCSGSTNALQYSSGSGIICGSGYVVSGSAASLGSVSTTTSVTVGNGLTVSAGGASITGGMTMATGAITPVSTLGITGTTTNNNAVAGAVGEYVTNSATGTSLTTATTANATSVSLTAGDWEVTGTVTTIPAGGTTVSQRAAGISTTSATLPGSNTGGYVQLNYSSAAGSAEAIQAPVVRISLASTTTVYLVTQESFSGSTATCNGFIRARRVR